MYKLNSWTENKKFNNSKIARNYFSTPCGSETTTTACGGEITSTAKVDIEQVVRETIIISLLMIVVGTIISYKLGDK